MSKRRKGGREEASEPLAFWTEELVRWMNLGVPMGTDVVEELESHIYRYNNNISLKLEIKY